MQEPWIVCFFFFNFLLASPVGFEPALQRCIASQKPNMLPTELSGYPISPLFTMSCGSHFRERSGRASDSESRRPGFDPHRQHRVCP